MRKIVVLLWVAAGSAVACHNPPTATMASVSVDSATRAASDTLTPSTDTAAVKRVDTTAKKTD